MDNQETDNTDSILLEEQLSDDPDRIEAFRISNPLLDSFEPPTHIARPADVDALQKLVKQANKDQANLTVASSTGNHRKGGFGSAKANILVDLSSWNQVLWINRRNRVCQIQPGVTYSSLLAALESHGMTVSMPLAPRKGKSIVAAVIDREPSTWPNRQWDAGDPVASTEFIFGNGEIFRTGAAGGPGSLEEQRAAGGAQKSPAGPSQTDFHRIVQGSQGTMGIVTWITLRTELKPMIQKPFLLGANSLDELIPFVYDVQRPWLGEHSFMLDRTAAALLMGANQENSFESIRDSIPEYICLQNIAGFERLPRERIEYQRKDIGKFAASRGLKMVSSVGLISAQKLLTAATNTKNEDDWRCSWQEGCFSIFFLSTLDKVPNLIEIFRKSLGRNDLSEKPLGSYIQPVVQNHSCHVELLYPHDPENTAEVEALRKVEREVVAELASSGAFFNRPYGVAADIVFRQNPFNFDLTKKLKGIFDPNGVLNNGKWGL
ncbi:MAG: FAD-binding oxidoreductase [Proteobacteria bacterium]|nr:FAD-binding oxidoreductase [Pseudomonadota bacterium]